MIQSIKKPIFLVGCMRSGTTLLADLLGRHSNIIHCPFELRQIWSKTGRVPMASPKTQDRYCPCLQETDVIPGQSKQLSSAFITEMVKNKGRKNIHQAFFLNKNPHLSNKLPFVNALFPDARFIWIYRDMPSVIASLKKLMDRRVVHYWPEKAELDSVRCFECFFNGIPAQVERERCFPGGNIKYLAEYWYETNKAISEFSKSIASDRIFLIKEEELISKPEKVLTDCQAFLGLAVQLPTLMIRNIDRNRNEQWNKRLTGEEKDFLLEFVEECGDSLNGIFSEGNLLERYKELISSKV